MKILLAVAMLVWCNPVVFAQEPDWVKGKSKQYPEEFYITGVGSGETRQDAESQARAHIAEVFKVNIRANISVTKSETLKESKSGVSAESREETRSRIETGLKKTLEGTEIAEVWQNPKESTYYALAVLEREKAAMKMAERIKELDEEIVRIGEKFDTTSGKIDKLRLMLLKRSLISDRMELDSDFRIVSPSGKGITPPYSSEREKSEIVDFLQNSFVIGIAGNGPGSDVMTQTVTDLFTSGGLTIAKAGGRTADLAIKVASTVQPPSGPVDEWYYCRWHLELNASEAATGAVIFSSSENGKSGQLSKDGATQRAIYDMNKKIGKLAGKVLDKLVGLEN